MIESRKRMLDQLIEMNKIGTVVFWRPDELVMFLGYLPCWGLSFLVVNSNGPPVLYVPEAEPRNILPKDIVVATYPWGILNCTNPWQVLFEKIKQQLIKIQFGTKRFRLSGILEKAHHAACAANNLHCLHH